MAVTVYFPSGDPCYQNIVWAGAGTLKRGAPYKILPPHTVFIVVVMFTIL